VVNAVFPPPLGPTRRKVGRLVAAAAFRYKKLCSRIGRPIATRKVIRIVLGFGESAAVSQLSSSYHAMAFQKKTAESAIHVPECGCKQSVTCDV
jgi:hypothetical protein